MTSHLGWVCLLADAVVTLSWLLRKSEEEVEDLSLAGSTIFFCPRSDESEVDVLRVGDIDLERSLRVARAK